MYIPKAYSRASLALASAFGMREYDEVQDTRRLHTLCFLVRDFVQRVYITLPTATLDVQLQAVIGLMENLVHVLHPQRVVVSMHGPVTLQQLHVARIDHWQQQAGACLPMDTPGVSSCTQLRTRINAWASTASCEIVLCPQTVPGDGLFKIRQVLRANPTPHGLQTLLFGRSNAHVLTSIGLEGEEDGIELDLFYVQPSGPELFMAQPKKLRRLLPYLVMFDDSFLPAPPPNMIYDLFDAQPTDSLDAIVTKNLASGELAASSYEDFLLHLRKGQAAHGTDARAYAAVVRTLVDYYTCEKLDSTLMYASPLLPNVYASHSEPLPRQNLFVLPINLQIALLAGGHAMQHNIRYVESLAKLLPTPPGPLPLQALRKAIRGMPVLIADGMIAEDVQFYHGHSPPTTPTPRNIMVTRAGESRNADDDGQREVYDRSGVKLLKL
jgi:hypothetical protein